MLPLLPAEWTVTVLLCNSGPYFSHTRHLSMTLLTQRCSPASLTAVAVHSVMEHNIQNRYRVPGQTAVTDKLLGQQAQKVGPSGHPSLTFFHQKRWFSGCAAMVIEGPFLSHFPNNTRSSQQNGGFLAHWKPMGRWIREILPVWEWSKWGGTVLISQDWAQQAYLLGLQAG